MNDALYKPITDKKTSVWEINYELNEDKVLNIEFFDKQRKADGITEQALLNVLLERIAQKYKDIGDPRLKKLFTDLDDIQTEMANISDIL